MSIEVTGRHMHDVGELKDFARDKGAELVAAFSRVEHVHVILDQAKHRQFKASVVAQSKGHIRVEAEEVSDNMRTSISAAFVKVEKQLRKFRAKVTDHRVKS